LAAPEQQPSPPLDNKNRRCDQWVAQINPLPEHAIQHCQQEAPPLGEPTAILNNGVGHVLHPPDGSLGICKHWQLMQTGASACHHRLPGQLATGRTPKSHTSTTSTIMSVERRGSMDRRTGKDRRQEEKGPPTNFERRRAIEARQPELTELHMSEDELKALGFAPTPKGNPRKTG